jgi:hypothetical protein
VQRRSAIKLISTGLLADSKDIVKAQLLQIAAAPASYRLQFLNPASNELAIALTETIIPADDRSAGAREANVNLFIDVMVGNSESSVREQWTRGLAAFEAEAQRRFNVPYARLEAARQREIMSFAAQNEANPSSELDLFFRTLKLMTLNGYYTSPTGIHREIQYKGNTALPNYFGCTHPEHQA